jgi:hypothetical protein
MGVRGAAALAPPWTRAAAALGLDVRAAAAATNATLLLWLGLMHINTLLALACLAALPHPLAGGILAALIAAALLPVERPFAAWQQRVASHICDTAHRHFPITLYCEDAAAFGAKGDKFVLGARHARSPGLLSRHVALTRARADAPLGSRPGG